MPKNTRAMDDALKSIKKDMDAAETSLEGIEGVSTGSIAVDLVTGIGGFPRRRMTEVAGWESSGKTTLCLTAAAAAQRRGLFVAYLDPEHGLDKIHAERIGFNWTDETLGVYLAPDTMESTIKIIEGLVKTDECDLIFVDSVPGLVPQAELEGPIDEVGQIAHKARLLASFIPRLAKLINKHNTALVLVNQMRLKINTGFASRFKPTEEISSGGSTLKFYFAVRLQTKLAKKGALTRKVNHALTGKEEEIAIANLHRVEAIKNKVSAPYREAEYYIRYDTSGIYGIDNITTIAFLAIGKGLIDKKGGWFEYLGDHKFKVQGENQIYQHLYDHPEALQEICRSLEIDPEVV